MFFPGRFFGLQVPPVSVVSQIDPSHASSYLLKIQVDTFSLDLAHRPSIAIAIDHVHLDDLSEGKIRKGLLGDASKGLALLWRIYACGKRGLKALLPPADT